MKYLTPLAFVLLALTGCSTAVQSQSGTGTLMAGSGVTTGGDDHPGSVAVLLGLDPVRQDLKLSSLQCTLLDSLRSEYKSRARKITAIGMDGEDAALRAGWDLRKLRKKYNERALAVLSSSQQDRLRQIERQQLKGNLLTSPSEQQLLGLSANQQQQIAAISASKSSQIAAINAKYNNSLGSSFLKDLSLHNLQNQTSRQMLAVLTDKQKESWLILSGQKMALPKIKDPDAQTKSVFEGY